MPDRPYTLLSCSVSIDGYIGSATSRLLLSNDADFDRVDEVRASCDAILVGAATVRVDNPRLLVRSPARRDQRAARGAAPSPTKVTVTLIGEGARPRAARSSRRAGDRTSSLGLSTLTVVAPIRMASQDARTASTRSKSASFDSSRREWALPMYPSIDMLQLSRV